MDQVLRVWPLLTLLAIVLCTFALTRYLPSVCPSFPPAPAQHPSSSLALESEPTNCHRSMTSVILSYHSRIQIHFCNRSYPLLILKALSQGFVAGNLTLCSSYPSSLLVFVYQIRSPLQPLVAALPYSKQNYCLKHILALKTHPSSKTFPAH